MNTKNSDKKYCIFHVPNYIDKRVVSGSQVRPLKMLQAFRNIGYEVDYVMGYGKERKSQIECIKENISKGRKYEFLYSESSTMPTLLTEKNHLPRYPFLDFGFMEYCKSHGIKIGLFYRDIHWKFKKYKEDVAWYKRLVSVPMYKYDLKKYRKLVDVLYLPSEKMKEEIRELSNLNIEILPPGAVENRDIIEGREKYFSEKKNNNLLKIFYVGGISGIYDLTGIFRAVKLNSNVYITVCCRLDEWEIEKERYAPVLSERVKIVHDSGDNLKQYYMDSDICACYFPLSKYMQFAVPIKLFEYTGYVTPVIATKGSEAGRFLEKWNSGFVINYGEKEINNLIEQLQIKSDILYDKHYAAIKCLEMNTWEQRAMQVEKDLKGD